MALELFINGTQSGAVGQINLYGDEPIQLNISVGDIRDISKKNSTFSQTFTIPADANNNVLLNHIFNIGSDSTFDPSKKTQCYILNDSISVFNGQFQLTKINVKNRNVISYECVVYGETIDFVKALGDKLLTDLDFSELNHYKSTNLIEDSWSADTKSLGYYYPLVDYGYDLSYNELNTGYFSTTIDYGNCSYASFSTFTDLDKLWVVNQYAGNQLYITSGVGISQIKTIVSNTATTLTLSTTFSQVPDFTSTYNITKEDVNNSLNSIGNGMKADLFKLAISNHYIFNKILSSNGFSYESTLLDSDIFSETIMLGNSSVDVAKVETKSYQKFGIRLSYTYSIPTLLSTDTNVDVFYIRFHRSTLTNGIATNGGSKTCFYQLVSRKSRVSGSPVVGMPLLSQDYIIESCMLDDGINQPVIPSNSTATTSPLWRYPLKNGEKVWVEVLVTNLSAPNASYIFNTNTSFFNTSMRLDGIPTNDYSGSFKSSISNTLPYSNTSATTWLSFNFNNDISGGNFDNAGVFNTTTKKYTHPDFISISSYVPKNIKQVDYIKSIITMFNLMVIPDKSNPKRLKFIPRNDYYKNANIKDWTNKVDHTDSIEETLLSEQQNKTIKLTYKADKDYYNTNYFEKVNAIYGEHIETVDNEWVDDEKKIEIIFSPTPIDKVLGSSDIYLPKIAKRDLKSGAYANTDFNVRFLFKKTLTTVGTIQLEDMPARHSYPYCGHLDHPVKPTIDYNFGQIQFAYYPELTNMTENNLVETYWQQYLDDINDKNSKLIKCKIYLTPDDIAKFDYNDSIFIDGLTDDGGHYFNVNKITYIPTSNLPSVVELIKVNRKPTEKRRRYTLNIATMNPIRFIDLGKRNSSQSGGTFIIGEDNNIGYNAGTSMIIGDNNTFANNATNVVIINSYNQNVTESFTTIVGNSYFPQQGESYTLFNDIDSGLDMVINPFSNTILNDIDSGIDAVRNIGGQSIISDIDSGVDGTKI